MGTIKSYSTVVGGLPLDVLKLKQTSSGPKQLILIIPGNPGIISYYTVFLHHLFQELGGAASVWAVSHSCSSSHKLNKRDTVSTNPLEIEIEHKLQFLEEEVPNDCEITLVGHSIGCYMIIAVLEILKGIRERKTCISRNSSLEKCSYNDLFSRIKKCYLLFPTVERMRISPKGKSLWPFINYLQWLVVGLVYIISWLPLSVRIKIASLAVKSKENSSVTNATVDLLTPRMVGNMLHLAHDELQTVNLLNYDSIKILQSKLVFYYGYHDGWCPLSYREELVHTLPCVNTYVDIHDMDHSFVISDSELMALELAKLIKMSN